MTSCTMLLLSVVGVIATPFICMALYRASQRLRVRLAQIRLPAIPRLAPAVPALTTVITIAVIVGALGLGWKHSVPCSQAASHKMPNVLHVCLDTNRTHQ